MLALSPSEIPSEPFAQAASVGNGCVASTYGQNSWGGWRGPRWASRHPHRNRLRHARARYDEAPHAFYSELLDFRYVGFEELMRESDVITLHVPLTPTTRHMINREALALCRPGVLLINTARGGLIDSGALIEALDAGQVAGVGLPRG